MKTIHRLKTWPEFFRAVISGDKTFEIRKNDRGFEVGDLMALDEWDPLKEAYTGRSAFTKITYVTGESVKQFGIPDGIVVIGFKFLLQ